MRAGTRVRPAFRLILACLLAVLVLPSIATSGSAEETPLTLAVHAGYRDVVRTGQWMPINVDVTNRGPDFQGTLEVQLLDGVNLGWATAQRFPGSAGPPVTYQLPLTLPSGSAKHLRTYVVTDVAGMPLVVRVTGNGRVLVSQTPAGISTASLLVGVLSDEPSAFDEFGALHLPANLNPQVVHLRREDLPDSAVLLRAFDLLAIDDFATDTLSPSQLAAVTDYVAQGGNLLLGAGPAWHKTLAALPPAFLPLQVSGTTLLTGSPLLAGARNVEIATGRIANGRAWLSDGDRPLVLEKTVGSGSVTLATFDWAQEPIATWSGTRGLLRQVAVRNLFGGPQSRSTPIGIGGAGAFFGGPTAGSSITQRSNFVMPALANLPALDLPSLKLVGLLVLLYVLLVGPFNYIVLRAIGRRELTWLTVPGIAVLFAAGAYGIAVGTKGQAVQSNQVSILHLTDASDRAYRETYTGVFAPARGDYTVSIDANRPLIAPIGAIYGPAGTQGGIRIRPDQQAVDLLGVTAFTLRGFGTESMIASPRITTSVRLQQGKLVGRVENHSGIRLTDTVLIAGDAYQTLGPLAPGAGADIELEPKLGGPTPGAPAIFRIYANPFRGAQSGASAVEQREGQQRTQILQMLLGPKGPVIPSVAPVLIAWTTDPLENIQVNGVAPRAHAQNALMIPVSFGALEPGPVPAGLVSARLTDLTGEVQPQAGGLYVQNGTATYEFAADLAPGAQLVGASISSSNPYGFKFGPVPVPLPARPGAPRPGTGSFKSEVWDWSQSAWVPLALAESATTAVPDRAVDPATGTVRLRVRSVDGSSFLLGPLSLTGTVQ